MLNAQKVFKEISNEHGREKSKKTLEAKVSMLRLLQICSAPFLITSQSKKLKSKSASSTSTTSTSNQFEIDTNSIVPSLDDFTSNVMDEDNDNIPSVAILPTNENKIDEWIIRKNDEAGLYSSKMKKLIELWKNLKEKNPRYLKVVIFANFTSSLNLAIETLSQNIPNFENQYVFVHGGITSAKQRDDLYTKFRTNSNIQALFMTLKLGSTGLNLSEANFAIIFEPWYSYSSLYQAESRIHRIGQMNPVNIYYLIARNSAEERVFQIAYAKKELAEEISSQKDFGTVSIIELENILFK